MAEINGYHIFGIPLAIKDAEMGISFSELENEIGGGYYSQVLFGSENGERYWRLTLPTLTGTLMDNRTVQGINGETLSWEEYIWDLFCEQKVNGTPFAYQDIRTNQYYLARFAQKELTFQRMLVKLYSTGLELKQWRISGEYVYSIADGLAQPILNGAVGWYGALVSGSPAWENLSNLGVNSLQIVDDVAQTGTQNGNPTMQFNLISNDGYVLSDDPVALKEAFLVMKMREAAFSNNAGVLSTEVTGVALVGDTGTTKFFNLSLSSFEYRLNGVLYAQTNQQAPMNEWGIVHVRKTSGVFFNGKVQMGKDRDFVGRFAEMDAGEVILFDELQPRNVVREIMEYLVTKWAI